MAVSSIDLWKTIKGTCSDVFDEYIMKMSKLYTKEEDYILLLSEDISGNKKLFFPGHS